MSLINLIIVLIIVGFLLWLANRYIPMSSAVRNVLNVVVIIVLLLWLIQVFFGPLGNLYIGHRPVP